MLLFYSINCDQDFSFEREDTLHYSCMPKSTEYIKNKIPFQLATCGIFICLLLLIARQTYAQSSGLIFASRETAPEKRTVLDLTPEGPICIADSFQMEFDISFVPGKERYSGYVFRIINEHEENIDLLYDGRDKQFKLVYKEAFTPIIFTAQVFNWNRFRIKYENAGISFWLNKQFLGRSRCDIRDLCMRIFFGANHYRGFRNTDLPSMMIKNLTIDGGGSSKYYWPLNELEGAVAADSLHQKKASVLNPIWVRSKHERWELAEHFTLMGNPSLAFDASTEKLFIVNNDSLYTYEVKTKSLSAIALKRSTGKLPDGNQSVYDPIGKRLLNFYPDKHHVAAYNADLHQWEPDLPTDRSLTAYWHVNKFVSGYDSSLYIMGGYGFNKYKNLVQKYNLYTGAWDTVQINGDIFQPRYLSALGQNAAGDTAWLLGGYGSVSGDQMLSPKYYYDLYVFDVKHQKMVKRFTLKEPQDHFVFSNSMVIDTASQSYYALIYPKDRFDTWLQLIKGSLKEPTWQLTGNQIPYWFNDAKSFSDLFYCPSSNMLLAVTITHQQDQMANVNIYSINTPPNTLVINAKASTHPGYYIGGALIILLVLAGIFILLKKYKRKQRPENKMAHPVRNLPLTSGTNVSSPQTGIFLFGNFTLTDQHGKDITHLFTPLLKELFLMILIYTLRYEKGVTLEKLNETFWRDMDERSAKNNRAVNIGKLKAILERSGNCTLEKIAGRWTLVFEGDDVYVDFSRFQNIQSQKPEHDPALMEQLLDLVRRGPFLHQEDYPWLDDIKSDVSNTILRILQKFSATLPIASNAELLINIANNIFSFDELNEDALTLKCRSLAFLGRHTIARNVFQQFFTKYREIYGEDFKKSFTDIVA